MIVHTTQWKGVNGFRCIMARDWKPERFWLIELYWEELDGKLNHNSSGNLGFEYFLNLNKKLMSALMSFPATDNEMDVKRSHLVCNAPCLSASHETNHLKSTH